MISESLITSQTSLLEQVGSKVSFKWLGQDDVLQVFLANDKNQDPLVQWKIASHCNIVPKKDDRGIKTVQGTKECNNNDVISKQDYLYLSTDIENPDIKIIPESEVKNLSDKNYFLDSEKAANNGQPMTPEALKASGQGKSQLVVLGQFIKDAADFEAQKIASAIKLNPSNKEEKFYFNSNFIPASINSLVANNRPFKFVVSDNKLNLLFKQTDEEIKTQGNSSPYSSNPEVSGWEAVASWSIAGSAIRN